MGKKVFLKIIQESYWSHDDDDEYSPINVVRKVNNNSVVLIVYSM